MRDREDWKRAVVHIEGAADSLSFDEQISRWRAIQEALRDPDANPEDLLSGAPPSRDVRFRGTAIFLRDEDRRYLLTARHVLTNETAARGAQIPMPTSEPDKWRDERIRNWIFPIIFRVPTLDEIRGRGGDVHREFLMNLSAGTTDSAPYTFSEPALDLAVISVDQRNGRFGDDLEMAGYEPITLEDISDEPSVEGADVFTVGYPDAIAVLGQLQMPPAQAHWAASVVSVPAFTFGRIAMLRDDLPSYWCDASIYPGNSGGPMVEDGQLVGIVSKQATAEGIRIPFGLVIKAGYIRLLLDEQRERDKSR